MRWPHAWRGLGAMTHQLINGPAYRAGSDVGRDWPISPGEAGGRSCVGDTPLHLAAWKGELSLCRMLVEQEPGQANLLDGEHHSPLHIAAYCGHEDILSLLVQPRFSPRVQEVTIYQDTPLHLACYSGKTEAARLLLAASPPDILRAENIWSETPLHAACTSGKSRELVNFLLGEEHLPS